MSGFIVHVVCVGVGVGGWAGGTVRRPCELKDDGPIGGRRVLHRQGLEHRPALCAPPTHAVRERPETPTAVRSRRRCNRSARARSPISGRGWSPGRRRQCRPGRARGRRRPAGDLPGVGLGPCQLTAAVGVLHRDCSCRPTTCRVRVCQAGQRDLQRVLALETVRPTDRVDLDAVPDAHQPLGGRRQQQHLGQPGVGLGQQVVQRAATLDIGQLDRQGVRLERNLRRRTQRRQSLVERQRQRKETAAPCSLPSAAWPAAAQRRSTSSQPWPWRHEQPHSRRGKGEGSLSSRTAARPQPRQRGHAGHWGMQGGTHLEHLEVGPARP